MAATAGYHGFEQSLDTDDTYETIFDSSNTNGVPVRGIRGIEIWCTNSNAEVLFSQTSNYGGSLNPATIVAGSDPAKFYFDSLSKVEIKQATVAGSTVSWRTIMN